LLKANFLTSRKKDFSLIETLLWHKGNFRLLKLHLSRLKSSCKFFDISLDEAKLKINLQRIQKSFIYEKKYKVRILVDRNGYRNISYTLLKEVKGEVRVKLSRQKIDSSDPFLYHKTTQRELYDSQRKKAITQGFFEVIFTNHKNQLTEGAISNIFILKNGKLYTPLLSCGLLPGILRQDLLMNNKAQEKILNVEDLFRAEKVFIGNSTRGLIEVKPYNIKVEDLENGVKISTK